MSKLVLFDLDGVLLDSWEAGLQVIRQLADSAGVKQPKRNFIRKKWGYTGIRLVKSIFPDLTHIEQERLRDLFKEFNNAPFEEEIKIVENAAGMLIALKLANKIGLCTNRSFRLREHLEKMKKVEFDIIISCDNPVEKQKVLISENHFLSKFSKPDQRFFEPAIEFAKKQNIEKEKIFFVGDTLVDFEGARNAGINFIGVLTGAINTKKRWWKWGGLESRFVVDSVVDLPQWFEKNNFG